MTHIITIPKEKSSAFNEDAISAFSTGIAVSDGAGGGGIFAELWSKYLVENIPEKPIKSYNEFDHWLSLIWEVFYNECEMKAKMLGGLALDKFYREGSFATLAASWISKDTNICNWLTYGDSVIFHYQCNSNILEYTISSLYLFNEQPCLINCKEEPKAECLETGIFTLHSDSVIFICSDALSHYIILMYMLEHKNEYKEILDKCVNSHTKNAVIVKTAQHIKHIKFQSVLNKLVSSSKNKANFRRHLESLVRKGLLTPDDYSFGYIKS